MQHVCGFQPGAESMGRGCVLTRAPLCISRVGMCLCCTSYRAVCSRVAYVSVHTPERLFTPRTLARRESRGRVRG